MFLNPQSANSSPLFPGCAGTSMLGFDAPQLFSLPPWAKAGIAMANIIAAITKASTTSVMMRLIKSTPSSPKGGTHHARYGTQQGKHDAKLGQAQLPYGLFSYAKWLFFWGELPRIPIPRTLVNRRKRLHRDFSVCLQRPLTSAPPMIRSGLQRKKRNSSEQRLRGSPSSNGRSLEAGSASSATGYSRVFRRVVGCAFSFCGKKRQRG